MDSFKNEVYLRDMALNRIQKQSYYNGQIAIFMKTGKVLGSQLRSYPDSRALDGLIEFSVIEGKDLLDVMQVDKLVIDNPDGLFNMLNNLPFSEWFWIKLINKIIDCLWFGIVALKINL